MGGIFGLPKRYIKPSTAGSKAGSTADSKAGSTADQANVTTDDSWWGPALLHQPQESEPCCACPNPQLGASPMVTWHDADDRRGCSTDRGGTFYQRKLMSLPPDDDSERTVSLVCQRQRQQLGQSRTCTAAELSVVSKDYKAMMEGAAASRLAKPWCDQRGMSCTEEDVLKWWDRAGSNSRVLQSADAAANAQCAGVCGTSGGFVSDGQELTQRDHANAPHMPWARDIQM